jgi:GTP-binding protein
MIELPKIALVGRPNVGKSTLFNKITGIRKAITDSRAGSTRDRNYAQTDWQGAAFELIDTGGLLLGSDDPLLGPAADQARLAIAEADLVLFLVDARAGLLPDDEAIARDLRRGGKKVVVAVNKSEKSKDDVTEFTRLGFDKILPLSAEHSQGIGDLLDLALSQVPRVEAPEKNDHAPLKLALVGRPNVGKSSILNKLLGEDRALVSPIPGTTRDAVDSVMERNGKQYEIVDTAGIRRGRLLKDNVDHVSVVQSRHSIERADVALVVIDAMEGIRDMDSVIAGYAQEEGRGILIVVNKWDLAEAKGIKQKDFEQAVRDGLKFLAYAPIAYVSAKTGRGTTGMLKMADKVFEGCQTRITTGELNRVLAKAAERYAPKAAKGNKTVKILYGTQIGIKPPTFVISLNHPVDLHFSYQRYLENQLRQSYGFAGAPIRIKVRTRKH